MSPKRGWAGWAAGNSEGSPKASFMASVGAASPGAVLLNPQPSTLNHKPQTLHHKPLLSLHLLLRVRPFSIGNPNP